MCRWVSPHFTEKLTNEKEMRQVGDDGWILWTRGSHIVIPPRFSIDKGFPVSDQITDNLLQTLERFLESPDENLRISQDDFDVLVVMTASKDETLFTGFRRYGKEPERFRNFALNHVNKKREELFSRIRKTKKKTNKQDGAADGEEEVEEEEIEEEKKRFGPDTSNVASIMV
eukprot:GEZU01023937.1.p1 GENE.GEZU01023937.1~~GEZU01023937.1.p1  ORF type:complete len:172 (-),score=45.98 GEZU01023937.1:137-652(-)